MTNPKHTQIKVQGRIDGFPMFPRIFDALQGPDRKPVREIYPMKAATTATFDLALHYTSPIFAPFC
jgi:hypothetical protein